MTENYTNVDLEGYKLNVLENFDEIFIYDRILSEQEFNPVKLYLDSRTGQEYAIKNFYIRVNDRNLYINIKNIMREIKIHNKIASIEEISEDIPKIITYFLRRVGNEYMFCIVMEFIEGYNLENYIRKFPPTTVPYEPQFIIKIAKWLFNIMYHLHKNNIVHRDIKPANIMYSYNLKLYLIDFGYSCKIKPNKSYKLCGSPVYISPENFRFNNEERWKTLKESDIWSCGITLYELTTGLCPWKALDLRALKKEVQTSAIDTKYSNPDIVKIINYICTNDYTKRPIAERIYKYLNNKY
jgi:serine/threonine protein kinase